MAVPIAIRFSIISFFVIGASLVATLVPAYLNGNNGGGGANLPCPIPALCLPQDIVLNDLTVTGNVECPPGSGGVARDCLPLVVETINTIPPWSNNSDFEIVASHGIRATGLPHGILLENTGLLAIVFLSPHPEFNGTLVNGVLFLTKNPQLANTFFAGPVSGAGKI
jgi:hypothetical protein